MDDNDKLKPGQKLTPEIAAELDAHVEKSMRDGAYCRLEEIAIAAEYRVSTRTVRRSRARVEAAWRRAGGRRDLTTERADWLERNRASQRDMRLIGKDPHSLMMTEARVLGLMQADRLIVENRMTQDPTTPEGRAALLADLRALPRELLTEALTVPSVPEPPVEPDE